MSDNIERKSRGSNSPPAERTCPDCHKVFGSAYGVRGHSWVHKVTVWREPTHSVEHPAAPLPPPLLEGGVGVAVAAASGAGERHPWKIDSPLERDRTCPTCYKVFASPKAMYGHLPAHKGRASTSKRPKKRDAARAAVVPSDVNNGKGNSPLSIDLNVSVWGEEEEEEGNGDEDLPISIDLNRTPPRI